jgi:hypothetical protein
MKGKVILYEGFQFSSMPMKRVIRQTEKLEFWTAKVTEDIENTTNQLI